MTQRVRVVFPWVVFLWLGVWLTTKPGQESGQSWRHRSEGGRVRMRTSPTFLTLQGNERRPTP